jgi:hypothetical protein
MPQESLFTQAKIRHCIYDKMYLVKRRLGLHEGQGLTPALYRSAIRKSGRYHAHRILSGNRNKRKQISGEPAL